jgi:hypothetical protein
LEGIAGQRISLGSSKSHHQCNRPRPVKSRVKNSAERFDFGSSGLPLSRRPRPPDHPGRSQSVLGALPTSWRQFGIVPHLECRVILTSCGRHPTGLSIAL